MQKYKIWAGTFLLVILGACASPTPPVPAPLQPAVHTQPQAGSTAATVVEITAPVWVASLSDAVNAAPLVSGDLVIVPTADGMLHALKGKNR